MITISVFTSIYLAPSFPLKIFSQEAAEKQPSQPGPQPNSFFFIALPFEILLTAAISRPKTINPPGASGAIDAPKGEGSRQAAAPFPKQNLKTQIL
jgi:hypothetical protein